MSKVNTLTETGRRLREKLMEVHHMLGLAPAGELNNAITMVAEVLDRLILNTEPIWEKSDTSDTDVDYAPPEVNIPFKRILTVTLPYSDIEALKEILQTLEMRFRMVPQSNGSVNEVSECEFGLLFPARGEELPTTEKEVTPFIRNRTALWRESWVLEPLRAILARAEGTKVEL